MGVLACVAPVVAPFEFEGLGAPCFGSVRAGLRQRPGQPDGDRCAYKRRLMRRLQALPWPTCDSLIFLVVF